LNHGGTEYTEKDGGEEGRRKKEEGRRKKEEGRRKKEEGREEFGDGFVFTKRMDSRILTMDAAACPVALACRRRRARPILTAGADHDPK